MQAMNVCRPPASWFVRTQATGGLRGRQFVCRPPACGAGDLF